MRVLSFLFLGVLGCGSTGEEPSDTSSSGRGGAAGSTGSTGGTGGEGTSARGGSGNTAGRNSDAGNGGSDNAGSGGMPAELPEVVNVELLGALFAPGKVGGALWDGVGNVPPETLEAVSTALGYPGAGTALGVMQNLAQAGLEMPDPFGFAELNWDGSEFDPDYLLWLATTDTNYEDTFIPSWPTPYPAYQDLYLLDGLQIRISLSDEDLDEHDTVPPVTLGYEHFVEAWLAGDSHWVRVDDQTQGQVIAIQLQVTGTTP